MFLADYIEGKIPGSFCRKKVTKFLLKRLKDIAIEVFRKDEVKNQ